MARADPDGSPARHALLAVLLVVVVGGGSLALVAALGRSSEWAGHLGPTLPPASAGGRSTPRAGSADGTLVIGVTLAVSEEGAEAMEFILDGVELAVADARERGILPGTPIDVRLLDHGVGGGWDPADGRDDMVAFAEDPSVIGVVGPFYDSVARLQIPVANEAGLLQCSPSNVSSDLTLGPAARWLQPDPERRTYLRVQAPEERAGAALARFARLKLGVTTAALIDDGSESGLAQAEAFRGEWELLDGELRFERTVTPEVRWAEVEPIAGADVGAVVYTGVDPAIPARLRPWLDAKGLDDRPLLSGPELGRTPDDGSETWMDRIKSAQGGSAGETYWAESIRLDYLREDMFDRRFEDETGGDPEWYGSAGYVCAEVILHAMEAAAEQGPVTREAVRAIATDPDTGFDALWGRVRFDEHGDIIPATFTIWEFGLDDGDEWDWDWEAQVELPNR